MKVQSQREIFEVENLPCPTGHKTIDIPAYRRVLHHLLTPNRDSSLKSDRREKIESRLPMWPT